jgi:hypothetical protein
MDPLVSIDYKRHNHAEADGADSCTARDDNVTATQDRKLDGTRQVG